MAREHARILVSIWDDPDFISLTSLQQRVYFAMVSSKDINYCGAFPLIPARLRTASDLTDRKIMAAIETLTAARFLVTDYDTGESCVRSYVRHDGILKMPNVVRAMNKAWSKVHSDAIREAVTIELGRGLADAYPEGIPLGICKAIAEGFGKGFVEGFGDWFANSPSPFPLPPSKSKSGMAYVANSVAVQPAIDAMPGASR